MKGWRYASWSLWLVVVFCGACAPQATEDVAPPPQAESAQDAGSVQWMDALWEHLVSTLEAEEEAHRLQRVSSRAAAEAAFLEARQRGERPRQPERAQVSSQEGLPPIRHAAMIAEFYEIEGSDDHDVFLDAAGSLTPTGEALMRALDDVDAHALDPAQFPTEALRAGLERLSAMRAEVAGRRGLFLSPGEWAAFQRVLESEMVLADGTVLAREARASMAETEVQARVLEALIAPETSPLPRIAAVYEVWMARLRMMRQFERGLEFALADAYLTYAETLKYGNLEKFSPSERARYTTEAAPNDIHPRHHDAIIEARLLADFRALESRKGMDEAMAHLASLLPQHEQYDKLRGVRTRYQKIVADGGWANVPPDKMFAGGRAPLVKALKTRLSVEGYYEGEIDDLFDDALTAAIAGYQRHHQLDETGTVDTVFWRSLNVPATQRLFEIEVNIRRWHRTMFEPRTTYIYVNVPSFEVELWHEGARVAVHRTVVGSTTRICNARTREWELINATDLMHARMTYLVFNPYWNVPPRIEVDVYQKRMREDPKWLENSDFEYVTPRGGGRVLRQKPGPSNALGQVKLIFPNRHNIYLHDTPKQEMFGYAVRAFSHGCIRVQGALELAQKILEIDGQWDEARIKRAFVEKGEHPVDLRQPIDVFIEYHTVTVDDDGAPYFLADVYRIIRNEIEPPTAAERRCDPAVDRVSSYRSGAAADSGP
ncbi:MAG: L,D-transpeptidase family protein [Proteobacteria bacterium]|nr:L,D-transpeptidase family protein [Pseudomonadota bacterium]